MLFLMTITTEMCMWAVQGAVAGEGEEDGAPTAATPTAAPTSDATRTVRLPTPTCLLRAVCPNDMRRVPNRPISPHACP